MTDPDLVAKKLALIETYVRELETLADPARIEVDLREERFVEHTLQIAVQTALDVASHIVSDDRLGEPRTNQELFELLAKHGFIDQASRVLCERPSAFETSSFTGTRASTRPSSRTCSRITSATSSHSSRQSERVYARNRPNDFLTNRSPPAGLPSSPTNGGAGK